MKNTIKICVCGLVAVCALAGCSGYQSRNLQKEEVIRSKFGEPLPKWARSYGGLIEEQNKTYFVTQVIYGDNQNNTANFERGASAAATGQLAQFAASRVNANLGINESGEIENTSSQYNAVVSSDIHISSMAPTATYWELINMPVEGRREYRAYAKVQVDPAALKQAMKSAAATKNPDHSNEVKQLVENNFESNIQKTE